MPALLAPYGARPGMPTCGPMIDAMLTMQPRPAASMRAPNARQHRYRPVRLTSRIAFHSSSVKDSAGPILLIPALLTSTVGSPRRSATAAAAASTDSVERTSSANPACSPPSSAASPSATRLVVMRHGDARARVRQPARDRRRRSRAGLR